MANNFASGYASIVKTDKNDDGTLTVYGKATDSSIDIDQQICDEAWLKNAMPQWMVSGGNIREQHSSIAAGVATEYEAKEDGHYITALVVDPVSVKKVETGVLKGFSIGIRGPRVVRDNKAAGGRIIDGQIVEISLVDRPANPNAKLMLAKTADSGELEAVKQITIPSPSLLADLAKGSEDQPRDENGRFGSGGGSGSDKPGSSSGSKDLQAAHEGIAKVAENLSFHLTGGTESDARLDARDKVQEAKESIDNAAKLSGEPALKEMQDGVNALYSALSLFQDHADQTGSRVAGNVVRSLSKDLDNYASQYKEAWDANNKSSDPDLVKFDPNQERDEHGRFGSGGGDSSPKESVGPDTHPDNESNFKGITDAVSEIKEAHDGLKAEHGRSIEQAVSKLENRANDAIEAVRNADSSSGRANASTAISLLQQSVGQVASNARNIGGPTDDNASRIAEAGDRLIEHLSQLTFDKSSNPNLVKGSEDQPRDENGRFASSDGGGSDSDYRAVFPESQPISATDQAHLDSKVDDIQEQLSKLGDFELEYENTGVVDELNNLASSAYDSVMNNDYDKAMEAINRLGELADNERSKLDSGTPERSAFTEIVNSASSFGLRYGDASGQGFRAGWTNSRVGPKGADADLVKFDPAQERDERGRFGSGGGASKDPVEQQRYRNVANGQVRNGNRYAERAAEDIRGRVDHHIEDIRIIRANETDPDKLGHLDTAIDHLSGIHDVVSTAESARAIGDYQGARSAIADVRSSVVAAQNDYRAATGQTLGRFNFGSIKEFVNNYQNGVDTSREGQRWLDRNKSAEADSKVGTMEETQQPETEVTQDPGVEPTDKLEEVVETTDEVVDPTETAKSIVASLIKFDKTQFTNAINALSNLIVVEAKEQKEGHSEVESIEQLLESVKHLYLWYDGEVREGEVPDATVEGDTDFIALSATKADGSCEHDCQACAKGEGCEDLMCKCSTGKSVSLDVDDATVVAIIDKAVASAKASVVDEIDSLKSALEAERAKAIQLEVELETAKKAVAPVGPKRTAGQTVDNTALLQKAAEYNQKAKATNDTLLAKGYRELAEDLIESSKKED